jgi:glycine/D-amino acid oxidase-like deaminating enzyme
MGSRSKGAAPQAGREGRIGASCPCTMAGQHQHPTPYVQCPMTSYGRSPWIDRFPKSRVPSYPRQRGAARKSVVVVGGGLTGCAAAYAFAAAGVDVALLEAAQIGRGNTGSAAGWIAEEPGVAFNDLEKTLGPKAARRTWQSWRRAALDFAALLRRLDAKCGLEPQSVLTVALTHDQTKRLAQDQQSRRRAGMDVPLLKAGAIKNEIGVDASLGLRARDGSSIDPYRACLGLAAAAADRGASLFEHSPVRNIKFGRKAVDVITARGTIHADRVVVATAMPTALFASLARHFWFRSTYLALTEPVPSKTRQQLGRRAAAFRDSSVPPHFVRWVDDDRILVCGADAAAPAPRLRDKVVVQRTGQLMYELSTLYPDVSGVQPAYGWAADYASAGDGLPRIGPHRNYPHHLFVFGDASHSVTGAYLASRVLLRYHLDEMDPADTVFGFNP